MKKSGISVKLNAGAATVILILTVIGLSVFAVLSLRAAGTELKLAKRSAEVTAQYYAADARAEAILFKLRNELSYGCTPKEAAKDIPEFVGISGDELVFEIRVNEAEYIRLAASCAAGTGLSVVTERRLVTDQLEGYAEAGFEVIDSLPYEIIKDGK